MQTVAGPMVMINTIMAEALDYIATELETAVADGTDFNEAVQKLLDRDHHRPRRRGLQRQRLLRGVADRGGGARPAEPATTLDALPELIAEAMELFEKYGVFSHREMHSRYEIGLEQYVLTIGVEAKLTLEIGTTTVLPAAIRYQTELRSNVAALKAAGVEPNIRAGRGVGSVAALRAARRRWGGAADHVGASVLAEPQAQDDSVAGDGRGSVRGRRPRGRHRRRPVADGWANYDNGANDLGMYSDHLEYLGLTSQEIASAGAPITDGMTEYVTIQDSMVNSLEALWTQLQLRTACFSKYPQDNPALPLGCLAG